MRPQPHARLMALLAAASLVGCGARTFLTGPDTGTGGGGAAGGNPATTGGNGGGPASSSVSSGPASSSSGPASSSVSSGPASSSSSGPMCTPEVCDGLDNDCNGVIDDGDPEGGASCATGQPGPCNAGKVTCQKGMLACVSKVVPSPEACDGIDNDCNGVVDDGCGIGCSDGTREGFGDLVKYPAIAGCSGGWSLPGVIGTTAPACNRKAGNSSGNPAGSGCNVADLCAIGFHVCTGPGDVAKHSPTNCSGAANSPGLFFATRQSGPGCGMCALGADLDPSVCTGCSCADGCAQTALTANDLFGCGSLGAMVSCGVLDRSSGNLCGNFGSPWSCGNDGCNEANSITKGASGGGGVLCCAD